MLRKERAEDYNEYRETRPAHTNKDGSVYEGQWLGEKPDGHGKLIQKNGAVYVG